MKTIATIYTEAPMIVRVGNELPINARARTAIQFEVEDEDRPAVLRMMRDFVEFLEGCEGYEPPVVREITADEAAARKAGGQ